jgi:CoA:oxalate CoA-transferase
VSDTLKGVRILDLTRMLAGPYATMLLADMGAEVVKVEDPRGGDPIREMGPPFVDGVSAYFLAINRNKKSITLDLKSPEGRDVFLQLVAASDVVIDNFRPGVTDRLAIGPEACRSARPDIVTCAITAFGSDGPYRDLPAFDLVLQAMGGGMSITGEPGRAPVRMGLPIGDLAGGMFAAQGVCGALFGRERTGLGQHIDVSLLDGQVSLLTYMAQYHWADGRVPGPMGTEHQTVVPYGSFACADGIAMVIAVFTDRFWPPFCDAMGFPELMARYPTNADRLAAKADLLPLLAARFRQRSADEWIALLRNAGIPCGPVQTVDRVVTDPQVIHRGMVAETSRPHPVVGTYPVLGNPVRVGDEQRYEPAPLLGEHNDELYGGLLGLAPERLAELRAAGVI